MVGVRNYSGFGVGSTVAVPSAVLKDSKCFLDAVRQDGYMTTGKEGEL